MIEPSAEVELTAGFLAQLDQIEAFLFEVDAASSFDVLLADLRTIVIPNLGRFPRMGRRFSDQLSLSARSLSQLSSLPENALGVLRIYLLHEYLILYAEAKVTVRLLSIRHHRQLSFGFNQD